MNCVSLFSGVGGLDLALAGYAKTVLYCECDAACAAVLGARMADGCLHPAPVHTDVRALTGARVHELTGGRPVDLVTAGFPCQDLSTAGARRGLDGSRSGLFWEIPRLVAELREKPRFLLLENVAGIRSIALEHVGSALAASGYDCRWTTLRVSALGGHHRRERWFCLARLRHPPPLADAQVGPSPSSPHPPCHGSRS